MQNSCLKKALWGHEVSEGRDLGNHALELAVIAWVRHRKTQYDELLGNGIERFEAREMVKDKIKEVLDRWTDE